MLSLCRLLLLVAHFLLLISLTNMNRVRSIILGAPGSGKGTISSRILKAFPIKHISSGDILRRNIADSTELGKKINSYVSSGKLVPDEIMNEVISGEMNSMGAENWLLDGYPRTLSQAEKLAESVDANLAINLVVPFNVIVDRLKSRWIHLASGRVYNLGFNDPKVPGFDDITNESLIQREDDKPEVVQKRLDTYSETINPVIEFYKNTSILHTFQGNTSDEIWAELKPFLQTKF